MLLKLISAQCSPLNVNKNSQISSRLATALSLLTPNYCALFRLIIIMLLLCLQPESFQSPLPCAVLTFSCSINQSDCPVNLFWREINVIKVFFMRQHSQNVPSSCRRDHLCSAVDMKQGQNSKLPTAHFFDTAETQPAYSAKGGDLHFTIKTSS